MKRRETNMTKSVKEPRILFLLILVLFALVHYPVVAASKPPAKGTVLPQFQLVGTNFTRPSSSEKISKAK
jgi:hypothetical protein